MAATSGIPNLANQKASAILYIDNIKLLIITGTAKIKIALTKFPSFINAVKCCRLNYSSSGALLSVALSIQSVFSVSFNKPVKRSAVTASPSLSLTSIPSL